MTRKSKPAANNGLLQAGQTCLNESVVHLIKFSACGQVGASIAPPDNKPQTVIGHAMATVLTLTDRHQSKKDYEQYRNIY